MKRFAFSTTPHSHPLAQCFQELHKNPGHFSARSYSTLAQWKFRDFNELPHLFRHRLHNSHVKATRYLADFPQPLLTVVAKFVAFVAGSFAVVLTLASVVDENVLLDFQITTGRSVLWYLGIIGGIWSVSRVLIPETYSVFDPEMWMLEVVADTHYLPPHWIQWGLHSVAVRHDFIKLFPYKFLQFTEELVSVMMSPWILWFSLTKSSDALVDFFRESTIHVDGLGLVCSLAVFDLRQVTPPLVATPSGTAPSEPTPQGTTPTTSRIFTPTTRPSAVHSTNGSRFRAFDEFTRSSFGFNDDKLQRSMVNFKQNFPEWEPQDMDGSIHLYSLLLQESKRHRELEDRRQRHEISNSMSRALPTTAATLNNRVSGMNRSSDTNRIIGRAVFEPSTVAEGQETVENALDTNALAFASSRQGPPQFPSPESRYLSNSIAITFPPSNANYPTATHMSPSFPATLQSDPYSSPSSKFTPPSMVGVDSEYEPPLVPLNPLD